MKKSNLVVKANILNESRYKLGVVEQRIILTMISLIKPQDKDFKPYSFTIKEFSELTGVSGQSSYGRIKQITKTLRNKGFTLKESDGDLQIGWVSNIKYYDSEARLELTFDPKLKPYLLALQKEFTRYQLKNTIRLKSAYSVRVYELLKQYQNVEFRKFDLDELRSLLGIPDKKLRPYGNFKRIVLDVAARELKENSDIYFYYKPIKTVRKITGIEFNIKRNETIIKKSFKPKEKLKKKIIKSEFDNELHSKKNKALFKKLDALLGQNPDIYKKLEKKAKSRLSKKKLHEPGFNLTIRFKMLDLMDRFIEGFKIKL